MPNPHENTEQERERLIRERFGQQARPTIDYGKIAERIAPMEEGKHPVENDETTRERLRKLRGWESKEQSHELPDLREISHFQDDQRPDELRELRHEELLEERARLQLEEREQRLENREERQEQKNARDVEAHEEENRHAEGEQSPSDARTREAADREAARAPSHHETVRERAAESVATLSRNLERQQRQEAQQRHQQEQQQRQQYGR